MPCFLSCRTAPTHNPKLLCCCTHVYSEESLKRVRVLTGCAPERLVFHNVDLCDAAALSKVLETCPQFHSCIHFAGLKVRKNERVGREIIRHWRFGGGEGVLLCVAVDEETGAQQGCVFDARRLTSRLDHVCICRPIVKRGAYARQQRKGKEGRKSTGTDAV